MKGLIEFVWTQLISTLGPLTVAAVSGLFSLNSFLRHQFSWTINFIDKQLE